MRKEKMKNYRDFVKIPIGSFQLTRTVWSEIEFEKQGEIKNE